MLLRELEIEEQRRLKMSDEIEWFCQASIKNSPNF